MKKLIQIRIVAVLLIAIVDCDNSNPLTPPTDNNFSISVDISESNNLAGNAIVNNYTEYIWSETYIDLTILGVE